MSTSSATAFLRGLGNVGLAALGASMYLHHCQGEHVYASVDLFILLALFLNRPGKGTGGAS